jgi:UDP-N-acetylmuramoyl-tripeptide--D-alanyl-D-alanine ligase
VIAAGKSELVQALPKNGYAILNYDDPWVRPMAEKTSAHVFYYGLDPKADLWRTKSRVMDWKGSVSAFIIRTKVSLCAFL